MKKLPSLLLATVLFPFLSGAAAAGEWVHLFNGKDLEGWTQRNGTML